MEWFENTHTFWDNNNHHNFSQKEKLINTIVHSEKHLMCLISYVRTFAN